MGPVQNLQNLNLLNYVDPTTKTHHSIEVRVSISDSNILTVKPLDPKLEGISVDIILDETHKDYKGDFVCKFNMNYSSKTSLDVAEFGQATISGDSKNPTIESKDKTFSLKQI